MNESKDVTTISMRDTNRSIKVYVRIRDVLYGEKNSAVIVKPESEVDNAYP